MSDLLQQAIIDATALKEAAIKNAENTLVEKYSQEFKETVQKLLEQEQAAAPADPAAATPPPVDPAAAATPMPTDTAADPAAGSTGDKKDAFKNLKTAFLDGPDDELITINFDQIKSTMMEMLGQEEIVEEEYDRREPKSDVTGDSLKAGAPKKGDDQLEEAEQEYELDEALYGDEPVEEELDEGSTYSGDGEGVESLEEIELMEMGDPSAAGAQEKADAARLKKQAADKEAQAASKEAAATKEKEAEEEAAASSTESATPMAESIEISEDELSELAEELRVDLKPESQGRGYMGSTNLEQEKLRNVEYAAARDDEAIKAREEEVKRMQDLVQENKNLKILNNKMMSMLESLKGEVEKINVSHAKLLYTNKALGNISLNERQKNAIVESISKADSVLEAKTIYETLQNAVETASTQKEAPQSLRETLNRAQTPFVVKKSSVNSINDVMAERMKALAGIKTK